MQTQHTTTTIHITKISNGSVYGHETCYCDESGCNGDEFFWEDISTDQVEAGDVVEIGDDGEIYSTEVS